MICLDEVKNELMGFKYFETIIDMVISCDVCNKVFMDKLGNKLLNEGYVNISSITKSIKITSQTIANKLKNTLNKNNPFETLNLLLLKETNLHDNIMRFAKKYTRIVKEIISNKNKNLSQELKDSYFQAIVLEIICIVIDNPINELKNHQIIMLIDYLLFNYLSKIGNFSDELNVKAVNKNNYVYNSNKCEIIIVNSIFQYIENIVEIVKSKNSNREIFYRGQTSTSYSLLPSIFRNTNLRTKEKEMIDELERLCPISFEGLSSILDRLVEMQHYSLPTRMLDISHNALVALLFACEDNTNDGEVILFVCDKKQTCYGDSDKVTLLTAISQLKDFEQVLLYEISTVYNKMYNTLKNIDETKPIDCYCKISKLILNSEMLIAEKCLGNYYDTDNPDEYEQLKFQTDKELFDIGNLYDFDPSQDSVELSNEFEGIIIKRPRYNNDIISKTRDDIIKEFNNFEIVKRLVRQVQREKHYFENRIIPSDLLKCLFVKPAMLNQRIIKQSGAFMVCGLMPDDKWEINKHLNTYKFSMNNQKVPIIVIPSNVKNMLVQQLSICDLHSASIYPEIDKVAEHIKKFNA